MDDKNVIYSTRWYDIIEDDGYWICKQNENAPEEAPSVDIESGDIVSITLGVQYFIDIDEFNQFRGILDQAEVQIQELNEWLHSDPVTASVKQAESKSDYAYTPTDNPEDWKLNISDEDHAAAAKAALGKGFRGNKVEIPSKDKAEVIKKVNEACKKYGLDPVTASAKKSYDADDFNDHWDDEYVPDVNENSIVRDNGWMYTEYGEVKLYDNGVSVTLWQEDDNRINAELTCQNGNAIRLKNFADSYEEAEQKADSMVDNDITASKFVEPEETPEYDGSFGEYEQNPVPAGTTAGCEDLDDRNNKKSVYSQDDVLACDDDSVVACDDEDDNKTAAMKVAKIVDVYNEELEPGDILEYSDEDGNGTGAFVDVIDVSNGMAVCEDEDGHRLMLSQKDIDEQGLMKNEDMSAESQDEARKERGEWTEEELQSFRDEADYDAFRDSEF